MSPLARQLREQIQQHGAIPFAQFMQCALYEPVHGYYRRAGEQVGRRGDFMTSVSVGPFFGQLLAFQFARWIERLRLASGFQIVEAGAHDGRLAKDILEALQAGEASLFSKLEYWILEPSPERQALQRELLSSFSNVRWWTDVHEIRGRVHGVVFSNELLDAMPVRPLAWNAGLRRWEEMGVTVEGELFHWARLAELSVPPPAFPDALLDVLPDGYIHEVSPAATTWWRGAADALASGCLMAIDYGGTLEELLSPGRTSGTLRSYAKHCVSADVLANPGEQDITAHVNFSEIRATGEAAGLATRTFTTQSQFLTEIARAFWDRHRSWPPQQVRQFQTLTHPEHLGRPFRVLVQAR